MVAGGQRHSAGIPRGGCYMLNVLQAETPEINGHVTGGPPVRWRPRSGA